MPLAIYQPKDIETHPTKKNEQLLDKISFKIHKFNNRPKPINKNKVLIISCFSEFGCETVGVLYCLPRLLKRFPGMYIITMGWWGRSYFYQHLVDEFWELDEPYQNLRDYTFAFHHNSKNLKNIEENASRYGTVIPSTVLGKYAVGNICKTCGAFWNEWRSASKSCYACSSTNIVNSLFGDAANLKKTAIPLPKPSSEKMEWAKSIIKENSVGIFARGRKTYGRNLEPSFYIELIHTLKNLGYNPIWLGEKQSTLPCPVSDVIDFSRHVDARDLEKTLSIVSQCQFTIQFWTASSRLSGMMGVPFILIESPEQIYCSGTDSFSMPGQEGRRLELTSFGNYKLVIAHYVEAMKDTDKLLYYSKQAINEIKNNNYQDIITDLVDPESTQILHDDYYSMIGKK